jgi:hypothetical protein
MTVLAVLDQVPHTERIQTPLLTFWAVEELPS